MDVFLWDFSGRCWSTLPGRCDVCSVQVPSWPAALWLQQYSAEPDNILCFQQASLVWAQCHANCGSALEHTCAQLAGSVVRVYFTLSVDIPSTSFSPQEPNTIPSGVKRMILMCFSVFGSDHDIRMHLPQS